MIAPTSSSASTTVDTAATLCLRLILQAEKIVDLMYQISEILSRDPAKILDSPSTPVYCLAEKLVPLLKQNAKFAPNKDLSNRMIRMSNQVQACAHLFSGIVKNSTEILYLDCLRKKSTKEYKKMWFPFKPPY